MNMVTIHLPRATGNEPKEEFAAVNGRAYLIKKGEDVSVPEPVYEVFENRRRARAQSDRFIDSQAGRLDGNV